MSTAVEGHRVRPRVFGLIGVFALLAWAANAAVLASEQFGYEFNAVRL